MERLPVPVRSLVVALDYAVLFECCIILSLNFVENLLKLVDVGQILLDRAAYRMGVVVPVGSRGVIVAVRIV